MSIFVAGKRKEGGDGHCCWQHYGEKVLQRAHEVVVVLVLVVVGKLVVSIISVISFLLQFHILPLLWYSCLSNPKYYLLSVITLFQGKEAVSSS